MKINKLESETLFNEKNNEDLKKHIDNLKRKLVTALSSVSLPGKIDLL